MENMTMRIVQPAQPTLRTLALLCATPATDLRTSDVRIAVRTGAVAADALGTDFWGKRVRVTAPTTGMGHVGMAFAGYSRGSQTWSPPI